MSNLKLDFPIDLKFMNLETSISFPLINPLYLALSILDKSEIFK